ncbi:hypothetical protein D3C75_1024460 [compost metagenome]
MRHPHADETGDDQQGDDHQIVIEQGTQTPQQPGRRVLVLGGRLERGGGLALGHDDYSINMMRAFYVTGRTSARR